MARAFWGAKAVDLESGETLYERNADHFFVPASNTKLFSTALALVKLGPDHRFQTVVRSVAEPVSDGILRSDLVLVGGGDPTLSARVIPYRKGPITGDPVAALDGLAAQLASRGLRRVEGDVVGDDTAYVWDPYPSGWAVQDAVWEYGAPVSALSFNDNALTLTIRPGNQPGAPAMLTLTPSLEHFVIDNRVRTGGPAEPMLRISRSPGSRQLQIWGSVPAGSAGISRLLAVDDPARFAALALVEALKRRGITVNGSAKVRHRFPHEVGDLKRPRPSPPPEGIELARQASPPLLETLRIVNKVSQNLHAELVLHEVARARRQVGSREAALEELAGFLGELGLTEKDFRFEDGSGLSRLTLITPSATVRLLSYMHRSQHHAAWLSLLPVGGQDGTLSDRFEKDSGGARIFAKTGTLSHVSALSGYAEPRRGGRLAFSILVNNYHASPSAVRRFIDRMALLLVE